MSIILMKENEKVFIKCFHPIAYELLGPILFSLISTHQVASCGKKWMIDLTKRPLTVEK